MKGRIERRASIGRSSRARTRASIRSRAKPVAGSKGHKPRYFRTNDGLSIANIFIEKEISIKNIDFFFFIAEQFNTLSTCKSKGL
jgi:hypothetical protein